MFRNYFLVALRNIFRNKFFSAVNIFGLAIGLACCFMILLYIRDEFSYDKFNDKADQIYRMAVHRYYPDTRSIRTVASIIGIRDVAGNA